MNEEYKCKDCKWLTGRKNIRGIECMNPKNQEKWNKAKTLWMGELRKDSARYKQGSALACKKFEAKESEHMGRYIDADALKEYIGSVRAEFNFFDDDERARYEAHSKAIYLLDLYVSDAPSIDIEPKRGEWMPIIEANEFGEVYQAGIYCSECGETLGCEANFCPNCGCRMKGADDE